MKSLTDIFKLFWPRFLQLVCCFLQSTSKAGTVLLFIHLNSTKFLGMVWEIYFPNSWSSALTFFPHQNVSSLVTFHLSFSCEGHCEGTAIMPISLVLDRQKADDEFLYIVLCIMHEHISCSPNGGTFSSYDKSGFFHCYKK